MEKTLEDVLAEDLPLWLLDVDGVVNCFPAPVFSQLMSSQDWRDALVGRYKIWWRTPVVEFINRMSREGLCNVVWLTTWDEDAPQLLAPRLGLDDFPVIPMEGSGTRAPTEDWWKLQRVLELIPEGARFVWTDDDLNTDIRRIAMVRHPEALLVTPIGNPGLEEEHLSVIESYLRALAERP